MIDYFPLNVFTLHLLYISKNKLSNGKVDIYANSFRFRSSLQ